jgi:Flp pilus assembly protein TadG
MKRAAPGQELVEFALIFIILMALVAAIVDLGRAIIAYNVLQNAVREGARHAAVHYNTSKADIEQVIRERTMLLDQSELTINNPQWNFDAILYRSNPIAALSQANVRVSATYNYKPFMYWIIQTIGASTTLSAQSTMRMEQFPLPTPSP